MSPPVSNRRPSAARQRQRYAYLKSLGYGWPDRRHGAQVIGEFRRLARAAGIDPDTLGDFARHNGRGGWPRPTDGGCRGEAAAEARRARYRALRAMGACAAQASEGSTCELAYLRVKREITGTVYKTQNDGCATPPEREET